MGEEHIRAACSVIREARSDDVPFLAWAVLCASRGHLDRGWFDIALNRPTNECLRFLQQLTITRTRSLWHYSRFLVAEVAGAPIATLCAYRAGETYAISPVAMSETIEALGLPPAESTLIWERGAYAFNCTVPPDDNCWVLESIATLPSHRRHGYTAALLDEGIKMGQRRGLPQAQITLLIGNETAERAYASAGFQLADEWRHADFEAVAGSPGVRRYIRRLAT